MIKKHFTQEFAPTNIEKGPRRLMTKKTKIYIAKSKETIQMLFLLYEILKVQERINDDD